MTEAWMGYMAPGEEHQKMAGFVGYWEMATKWWKDPNAPAGESTNKVTIETIMGGRYLLEHVHGEPDPNMGGMAFEGMSVTGFDNHKKKYVFSWIDNMATGVMHGEGSANHDGSVITYMTEEPDLFNPGQMTPVKSITTIIDHDHHTFEMWKINESGEWWKSFEGTYTRTDTKGAMKGH